MHRAVANSLEIDAVGIVAKFIHANQEAGGVGDGEQVRVRAFHRGRSCI